jgi:hypothetical protein
MTEKKQRSNGSPEVCARVARMMAEHAREPALQCAAGFRQDLPFGNAPAPFVGWWISHIGRSFGRLALQWLRAEGMEDIWAFR